LGAVTAILPSYWRQRALQARARPPEMSSRGCCCFCGKAALGCARRPRPMPMQRWRPTQRRRKLPLPTARQHAGQTVAMSAPCCWLCGSASWTTPARPVIGTQRPAANPPFVLVKGLQHNQSASVPALQVKHGRDVTAAVHTTGIVCPAAHSCLCLDNW
jgi:hypothetical protein